MRNPSVRETKSSKHLDMSEFSPILVLQITSKQKTDRTKIAIKNENITSFGGSYIISLWLFILPHWFGWGISCLDKSKKHQKAPYQCIESQKTSQYIKFPHKKKCCGIKALYDAFIYRAISSLLFSLTLQERLYLLNLLF